jgi:tRNA(Ile)-lysidine synthase
VSLPTAICTFLDSSALVQAHDKLLVAFSGGPDSTALLWGLQEATRDFPLTLHAHHIDHALDGDSDRRASQAAQICRSLGIDLEISRLQGVSKTDTGGNREAQARRLRYEQLEAQRQELGATAVLTAHHADDQIETVLMRMLYGSGVGGLTGVQQRRGRILRPLLEFRRQDLRRAIAHLDVDPVEDPTNYDLGSLRNRIRHLLLPSLRASEPTLDRSLLELATAARRCRQVLDRRLAQRLEVRPTDSGLSISRRALQHLPAPLWPAALAMLHRGAAIPYPPSAKAVEELRQQIARAKRIGVDCGGGWRWIENDDRLILSRPSPPAPSFAYTVEAPGECDICELGLRFRIRRGAVDDWMFRPSSRRAGLDLPIRPGDCVVVRSRRAGDRVRPLGSPYRRRLKDVLIDRRVPRADRNRIPLLEVDSRLAWIPGVTVSETFRVAVGRQVWIAELEMI